MVTTIHTFETKEEAIAATKGLEGAQFCVEPNSAGGYTVTVTPLDNKPAAEAAPEKFDADGMYTKGGKRGKSKRGNK